MIATSTGALLLLLLWAAAAVDVDKSRKGEEFLFLSEEVGLKPEFRWQPLTSDNFTEDVRTNEFSLCIARVEWCGEARSLMNGILKLLKAEPGLISKLKLRFVNSNEDKRLSDVLSAGRLPAVTFFRRKLAFKYGGRLTAHLVVASVRQAMSIPLEDFPLKHVKSKEELHALIETTDMTVVLIDQCGWTGRTLSKNQADEDVTVESHRLIEEQVEDVPLFGSPVLGSLDGAKVGGMQMADSVCTSAELERFEFFYHNLSRVAMEHVLTPPRAKFTVVSDEKIAIAEGFGSSQGQPWLLTAWVHDFTHKAHVLKADDDLENFLRSFSPLVVELEGYGVNSRPAFLRDTPSVVLFIDRAATSPEDLQKSNEALNVLRKVAWHYRELGLLYNSSVVKEQAVEADGAQKETATTLRQPPASTDQGLQVKQSPKLLRFAREGAGNESKDKKGRILISLDSNSDLKEVSIPEGMHSLIFHQMKAVLQVGFSEASLSGEMLSEQLVPDEVVQVSYDPNGILERFIGSGEIETELLRVVKNIEEKGPGSVNLSPELQNSVQGIKGAKSTEQVPLSGKAEVSQDRYGMEVASQDALHRNWDTGALLSRGMLAEEDLTALHMEEQCASLGDHGEVTGTGCKETPDERDKATAEETATDYLSELQIQPDGVEKRSNQSLAFFFWDGESQLKQKLTTSDTLPSLVVLHPLREAHYVYPLDLPITRTSVVEFLDLILRGKLRRTIISEPDPLPPREQPRPPFVKDHFHAQNPVPRVTVDSFQKLVFGYEEAPNMCGKFVCVEDSEGATDESTHMVNSELWEKDVVVLFTTSWCGFCKRMELVLSEVHRAISRYMILVNSVLGSSGPITEKASQSMQGNGLPVLLQMDCVLNDCSERMKKILKEEVYPTLVLFPAQKKSSPVVYDGPLTVLGLITFVRVHGTASVNLHRLYQGASSRKSSVDRWSRGVGVEVPSTELYPLEISTLPARLQRPSGTYVARDTRLEADRDRGSREGFVPQPEKGGFLVATDKLGLSSVFQSSVILLLGANTEAVWGVIINKPMLWQHLVGLDSEQLKILHVSPISYGGPSAIQGRPFFVLTKSSKVEGLEELSPGTFSLGPALSAEDVVSWIESGRVAAHDLWFFLGSAIWGLQQLQDEIARGFWQPISPRDGIIRWPSES